MRRTWQLQEAKNRFSELVNRALHDGPQAVTRHGKEVVVVVSADEFRQASGPKTSLIEFFKGSPLYGLDLKIKRNASRSREIDFE